MERPQEGPSVLGWDNLRGVIQSWDRTIPGGVIHSKEGTTPGKSFSPRIERPQGVFQFLDGTNPGKSFSSRMERPQEGASILGWHDPRGVIQS